MIQTGSFLPSECSKRILCVYANTTSQIQTIRITNILNFYFERVVFPGQRLLFEAVANAQLEIQTCTMEDEILSDRITCKCLAVNENCDLHGTGAVRQ